jgi:hypothetical protein
LIDGFPRNQDNIDGWNKVVGDEADVHSVLFFDCSEVVDSSSIINRIRKLLKREFLLEPQPAKKRELMITLKLSRSVLLPIRNKLSQLLTTMTL